MASLPVTPAQSVHQPNEVLAHCLGDGAAEVDVVEMANWRSQIHQSGMQNMQYYYKYNTFYSSLF